MIKKNLDIEKWEEFRVGDLFDIIRGKSRIMRNLQEGSVPLIAAARYNQGIAGFYDIESEYQNSITISCNGVGCGSSYYHKGSFSITGDAVVCIEKIPMSNYSKVFIASIFDKSFSNKYSYSEKCGPKTLINEIIKLPSLSSHTPNWEFMEEYMKKIMDEQQKYVDELKKISLQDREEKRIDVEEWGEYRVGDLFEIYHGKRLKKADRTEGEILFLTAGKENQGVCGKVGNNVKTYNNSMTIDMFGNCFYHKGLCSGDDNIYFFINNNISGFCKLFIVSYLNTFLKNKYSFTNQFRQKDAELLTIKLPSTPQDEPDWVYMEQYMQNVLEERKKEMDLLKKNI